MVIEGFVRIRLILLLTRGSNPLLKLAYLILDISTVEDPPSARRAGMSLNKWNQAKGRLAGNTNVINASPNEQYGICIVFHRLIEFRHF